MMLSDIPASQREHMLLLHREMLRIRLVEEEIAEHYAEQEMRCPVHLSIGQEAIAVGICQALRQTDRVFSTHRCHAHYLAKGGDLKAMLAEIYGKAAGCIGGRGGSMHLTDPEKGMIASVPIVSSSIPLAAGVALSDQLDGNDNISVAFIGDASVEEGVFHETANFASLRKLPLLFVCENNLYSVYTPLRQRQPDRVLAEVACAHGVRAIAADGNNVGAVLRVTEEAVNHARSGGGPTFLVFDTYRWREHCGPNFDNNLGYRTEEEYEEWRVRCPIELHRRQLESLHLLNGEKEQEIIGELKREIAAAFAFAKAAPLPESSEASAYVYA
jgi:pyruvate dehydrogenase E1 component alpha subunit